MDPSDHYSLQRVDKTHSKKFKTTADRYLVEVHDIPPQTDVSQALELLRNILRDISETILGDIPDNDFIRITINSGLLDYSISIPFCLRGNFNIDRILDEVERVVQSQRDWLLQGQFSITLYHVEMPRGGVSGMKMKGRGKYGVSKLYEYLKKKKSVVVIENRHDNLCMARAIVISKAALQLGIDSRQYRTIRRAEQRLESSKHGRMSLQKKLALALQNEAGISGNLMAGLDEAVNFQNVLSKEGIELMIFSFNHLNSFIFRGRDIDNTDFKSKIYIGLYDRHFCAITKINAFFESSYYCDICEYPYDSLARHHCQHTCQNCLTRPICEEDGETDMKCENCNKVFKNLLCYTRHIENNVCENIKRCLLCNSYYKKSSYAHICGTYFCRICIQYRQKGHRCYVQRLGQSKTPKETCKKAPPVSEPDSSDEDDSDFIDYNGVTEVTRDSRIFSHLYFDFETSVVDSYLKPIVCVVEKVCNHCEHLPIKHGCDKKCGKRRVIFTGEECLDQFCQWLFSANNKGYIAISHNGGNFDCLFILRYLHDNLIYPKIITRSSKIIQLIVKEYGIYFIDSLNFIQGKLSDFPKIMGLSQVGDKGYFPYKALKREFYDYVGPKLDIDFYSTGSMKSDEREKFLEWYENLGEEYIFHFKRELVTYCVQDVTLLREGCLKFRKLIIDYAGIDPFITCTLASLTTLIWRTKFMPENTVGVIPEDAYTPSVNTSFKSIGYMEYLVAKEGKEIMHAGRGGEVKVNGYFVDGVVLNDEGQICEILEFQGCLFHACLVCYCRDIPHPLHKGLTFGEVNEKSNKKINILKESHNVTVIWEHAYDNMLKIDEDFREFISTLDLEKYKNIKARDGLYGGRVECFVTHYECKDETESIEYVDSRSMYGRVLRDRAFVKGHPQVKSSLTHNMGSVTDYNGICKLLIVCPQNLKIPLLPHRSQKTGKLTFPVCARCADLLQTTICNHNDRERALLGVYTTDELKKALSLGYRILEFYQVWHYEETCQYKPPYEHGIFSEYINTFHRLKTSADGFPTRFQTPEEKKDYLRLMKIGDNIDLNMYEVKKEPGVRSVAKALLNNLWGRQAINMTKSQVMYFTEPDKFYKILRSHKYSVDDIYIVNDHMIWATITPTEDFVPVNTKGSIVLAIQTTSFGRLFLYEAMETVGPLLCYVDTDSLIYIKHHLSPEVPLGYLLGEFKSELKENDHIVVFVSCGLKSYGFRTKQGHTECRIKGFTLDHKSSKDINLDSMTAMVTKSTDKQIRVTYDRLRKDRQDRTSIRCVEEEKTLSFVFDKRILLPNGLTAPFGYKGSKIIL